MTQVSADGIRFDFRAEGGVIEAPTVTRDGRDVAPLHRAPWVGTGEAMPQDAAPHMAWLGGDFFCAPFAIAADGVPLHGWPANAEWDVAAASGGMLEAVLTRDVQGARVTKTLRLRDGHPFVYQRHVFEGGAGAVPVANHANVALPRGGLIRASPKAAWRTPPAPQEGDPARGRSALRYPATAADPSAFPGADGPVDLARYPWGPAHEDFVSGIEEPGRAFGWTAVTRPVEGDLFLSLRDPRALPMTMLWHSNGGRDYAPWSGRHRGCLGVEEGAAAHMLPDWLEGMGPGALLLGGRAEVRHVIGAWPWPSGAPVVGIEPEGDVLRVEGGCGTVARLPFDAGFLDGVL